LITLTVDSYQIDKAKHANMQGLILCVLAHAVQYEIKKCVVVISESWNFVYLNRIITICIDYIIIVGLQ